MGQQICYLYEYKESVPVRNVGFIRAEQKRIWDSKSVIYMNIKNLYQ